MAETQAQPPSPRGPASEQMAKAAESQAASAAKGQNLGVVNTRGGFGAGAGGGFGLNAPGFHVKVSGPQAVKGSTIDVDEGVHAAWNKVLDDTDPLGWVICMYVEGRMPLEAGKKIFLADSGPGGMSAFKAALPVDKLAWGAFRIAAVDRRGGVDSKRPKFIFIHYACERVGQIKKAKMIGHKGDLKGALTGCHLDLMVEKLEDLEEQDLMGRLQAATGAHKPNGYEFDEGAFLVSDYYGLGIGEDCKGETAAGKTPTASGADGAASA